MFNYWYYVVVFLGEDDNEDEIPPLEHGLELLDLRDSDVETYDPANPDEDDYF